MILPPINDADCLSQLTAIAREMSRTMLIKDVAKWGGDVTPHVPEMVARRLVDRLRATAD